MKAFLKRHIVAIMQGLAKAALRWHTPYIIVVVGSVGKTSTKEAIYAALKDQAKVRKSDKSYNSEVGVPLAILGLKNAWSNPVGWTWNIILGTLEVLRPGFPDYLVLEVGSDHPGDVAAICSWLKPDITVVTRFGKVPVHIEYFKDRSELILEDGEAVRALKKGGTLVVNADDEDALSLAELTKAKVVRYGEKGDMGFEHYRIIYGAHHAPEGITFKVISEGANFPVRLYGALGHTQLYALLAALAVARSRGFNILDSAHGIERLVTPPGRLKLIPGVKHSVIIDDTYNASPVATEEALSTLGFLEVKRTIAVLGDMLELGGYSDAEHLRIGTLARDAADVIVTVGERARNISSGAFDAGFNEKNLYHFDDSRAAGRFLQNFILPGDVILVKGSQSMRMERAVEEIMAHPAHKKKILVRQDKEWEKR